MVTWLLRLQSLLVQVQLLHPWSFFSAPMPPFEVYTTFGRFGWAPVVGRSPFMQSLRFDMNESTCLFFLAGLLVGLAVFDFMMLFYYILV